MSRFFLLEWEPAECCLSWHTVGQPWFTLKVLPPIGSVGEVFPLETRGFLPPLFADLHWLSLSDSLTHANNNAQTVVITCVEMIIYHPVPIPPSPLSWFPSPTTTPHPPDSRIFKGGFYSAEQFKRKWLLFPSLVCTSVRRWLFRRKWGPGCAGFQRFSNPVCVWDGWLCSVSFLIYLFFFAIECLYSENILFEFLDG